MPKGSKFGVYVPKELVKDLERCMITLGIKSKSKVVQEALSLFILENRWRLGGKASGVIGVVYKHHDAEEELTEIQHQFLDVIISAVHVHLDKELCMLVIIVRGDAMKIKELMGKIMPIKGVKLVRPMLLST